MLQGRSLGFSIRHVRVEVAKSIGIPGDLSDLKCYQLLCLCLCLCSIYVPYMPAISPLTSLDAFSRFG